MNPHSTRLPCLTDDERDAIAVMLAGTDSISAIVRRTQRHRATMYRILKSDPELRKLRAAALKDRKIKILDRLLDGLPFARVAALHGVGRDVVRALAAPVREQIAAARSVRPWTGENLDKLLVARPRIDDMVARFGSGQATVQAVITAVNTAEIEQLEGLLQLSASSACSQVDAPFTVTSGASTPSSDGTGRTSDPLNTNRERGM
ncbi:hypothetical protein SAMN05421805_10618 [Saccharopolyspora antimicrobica]|uniref:Helix-turn-helix domain-containing protein n=1 Tax=Saccharopolyspora antimicrobica TaxID=455193 RepID=A0A1I5AUZ2_9PSEU|nr:helix-turn-helix domain-containing protein [Saccharopolyspora antimicrobica]RKT86377.1 hypothetical protein ATL45_4743 [Saccharopolyspora antimicrobica]SFN66346.1 hypothetical protein SAMN05421805_10618 [Saccharopolyspora antimicrobica]